MCGFVCFFGNTGRVEDAPPHVVMAVLDIDVRGSIKGICEVFAPAVLSPPAALFGFSPSPQEGPARKSTDN